MLQSHGTVLSEEKLQQKNQCETVSRKKNPVGLNQFYSRETLSLIPMQSKLELTATNNKFYLFWFSIGIFCWYFVLLQQRLGGLCFFTTFCIRP